VAAITNIRRFVGGLRPPSVRQFCIARIYNDPQLRERARRYFLDSPRQSVKVNGIRLYGMPNPKAKIAVCVKFFKFVIGKSTNFLYQPGYRGREMVETAAKFRFRRSPKTDAVVLFMMDIAQYYQLSPDKKFIFLPFAKRQFVYDLYQEKADKALHCGKQFVLAVWRENALCNHIKLRKHLLFALCDTCVEFRDVQLLKHTHAERMSLRRAQIQHHDFIMDERRLYYWRRGIDRNGNEDAMSMIVDAADQQKYALPYHHVATHLTQKALRVPVHLMGVLVHGEAVHAYTYFENFKQGNNVTIEAIHSALCDKLARDGCLPTRLYLQLDNTSKQCKGRYMIGWLGYLVHVGRFDHIVLSFLPVGHTHEDIDQVFSRLAVYLATHDALNMAQLHDAITNSYESSSGQRAQCEFWDRCANFSEWIADYLSLYDGISRFRQFRFFKRDGVVRVQARAHTSMEEEWAGIRGQDAWTPVFRCDPPASMDDVPPTQRRDLLSAQLVENQKASISAVGIQRLIDPDLLVGVLAGVDSLGDPTDLEFNWDLSRCMSWDPDADGAPMQEVKDEDIVLGPFPYQYPVGECVLFKPTVGAEDAFWVGLIMSLGLDAEGRRGEVEICWLSARKDYGTYNKRLDAQKRPMMDWQYDEAIQDNLLMVSHGRKISARSVTAISHWIERWAQDDIVDGNDGRAPGSDDDEDQLEFDV
jgi:hypothetical protein